MDLQIVAAAGAAIGVASHLGYFINGEHHRSIVRIVGAAFFIPVFIFTALSRNFGENGHLEAAKITAVAVLSYTTALFSSMTTYRVFFHPLKNFPGPFSLKVSKFAHLWAVNTAKNGPRDFEYRDGLHKQFGEFVRVGPNELSLISPDAISTVLGPGSKCTKSIWYDCISIPEQSVHYTRSKQVHDLRRRVWDQAFSMKALRGYERRVTKYADQLQAQLTSNSGKDLNVVDWFTYFAFDLMGDLAFGAPFDMLLDGKADPMAEIIASGTAILGPLNPIIWIIPLLKAIPGLASGPKKIFQANAKSVEIRKGFEPESPDLFTYLFKAHKEPNTPFYNDPNWLIGDSALIITAGTETTTITFTYITYYLAHFPEVQAKLLEELKEYYRPGYETEYKGLANAPYLNGIINETLRLHPPIPGGLYRLTPPEGITIGSTYIPGGTTVSTPFYSISRLESCFKKPNEFIPERWGESPELIIDKSVFQPFSLGSMSCVGKGIALMELRKVTAQIVSEFEVGFSPKEDGYDMLNKSPDAFTLHLAPLMMQFKKRAEKS